jgi:rubrerythrin
LPRLSPKELLATAIKSEIEAAQVYLRLSELIKNFRLKEKLNFLRKEEEFHQNTLERIYQERFSDQKLVLPEASLVPRIKAALGEEIRVPALFLVAMEAEQASDIYS